MEEKDTVCFFTWNRCTCWWHSVITNDVLLKSNLWGWWWRGSNTSRPSDKSTKSDWSIRSLPLYSILTPTCINIIWWWPTTCIWSGLNTIRATHITSSSIVKFAYCFTQTSNVVALFPHIYHFSKINLDITQLEYFHK